MRKILCLISALALLALPAAALAQDNSALDQYTEDVPGGGNNNQGGGGGNGGGGSGGGDSATPAGSAGDSATNLSPSAAQALADQGPAGVAAAKLAEATKPRGAQGNGGQGGGGGSGGSSSGADSATGGAPSVGEVVGNVAAGSDSDGLGSVLPIILVGLLVAALAFVYLRRRGAGPNEAP